MYWLQNNRYPGSHGSKGFCHCRLINSLSIIPQKDLYIKTSTANIYVYDCHINHIYICINLRIILLHVFLHVHEATEPKYITRVQCWRTRAKRQSFLTAEGRTPYVANIIWQSSVAHWVYCRCTHRKYTVYIISIMYTENSINTVLLHYIIVYKVVMKHRHKHISKCFYFLRVYILRNYFMLHQYCFYIVHCTRLSVIR